MKAISILNDDASILNESTSEIENEVQENIMDENKEEDKIELEKIEEQKVEYFESGKKEKPYSFYCISTSGNWFIASSVLVPGIL